MGIDRRSFLTASARVILTVTTIGGKQFAQAAGARSPERPWQQAFEEKSADPRIRAMAFAILAPNVFNLQPWLAELPGDDRLLLHCDPARRLPQCDREDRETVISFGNFLELLRMAAAQDGYRLEITAFPEGEPYPSLDARPIASVRFIKEGAAKDPLFASVLKRRTCKLPFDQAKPVEGRVLTQLSAAGLAGTHLQASNDDALVARLRRIASDAIQIEKSTSRINLEKVAITRIGPAEIEAIPDGIALRGPMVESAVDTGVLSRAQLAIPDSIASQNEINNYRRLCDTAKAYVWLSTGGNKRADQLAAGRDWLRLHLKATELGVAFEPQSPALNDYPEMRALLTSVHETLSIPNGQRVQMLGRLGYAPQSAEAARWPVETRILPA